MYIICDNSIARFLEQPARSTGLGCYLKTERAYILAVGNRAGRSARLVSACSANEVPRNAYPSRIFAFCLSKADFTYGQAT